MAFRNTVKMVIFELTEALEEAATDVINKITDSKSKPSVSNETNSTNSVAAQANTCPVVIPNIPAKTNVKKKTTNVNLSIFNDSYFNAYSPFDANTFYKMHFTEIEREKLATTYSQQIIDILSVNNDLPSSMTKEELQLNLINCFKKPGLIEDCLWVISIMKGNLVNPDFSHKLELLRKMPLDNNDYMIMYNQIKDKLIPNFKLRS